MSTTYTFSGTNSYSVADVKAVMQNTYEDIIGFANRQMAEYKQVERWIEDLIYILNKKALSSFELQLYNNGERFKSYRYEVNSSEIIPIGNKSGGINYFEIPSTTKVGLFANLNENSSAYQEVMNELLNNRGWGTNGSAMNGNTTYQRNYVSNNLQIKRSEINK